MCGISGIVNLNGERVDPVVLREMIDMIRHRGPDDSGTYTVGRAGLAHTRLSIIDLLTGQQPMHNEDKSLWISFNGEIFNYLELREELVGKGHKFSSRSDTEVALHLYEEEGEECVNRFNGQWAFAIWDEKRKKLFASRDRLGVRPFFYTVAHQSFIFASEIKAIFAHPGVKRDIDLLALEQLFTFWHCLPPRTIFKDICELPPAHSLTVEGGKVRVWAYWCLNYSQGSDSMSEQDYADRLRELLEEATRLRLRSDVPVGAYLSGGLDSSIVSSLVKQYSDAPFKTFSVTFENREFDESIYQKEVTSFLQTDHQALSCSSHEIGRVFPDVIWHTEKPVLRTAPGPLYLLSKSVRDHGYKVVLTGEGSDEILGGYDIFKEAKIRRFWGAVPDSRIRPFLLKRLYPYLPNLHRQSTDYLKAFFHVKPEDLSSPFFSHLPRWGLSSRLKIFFSDAVNAEIRGYDPVEELRATLPSEYSKWDVLCQAQYLETRFLLPGYILSSQGDRVAMAHSIEGRFPFLDHRVVEFAARIPPGLKMKGLNEKYLLKQAAGDLVPASVKSRTKQPYRAPEAKSFLDENTGSLQHKFAETLLSSDCIRANGVFNPSAVCKLIEKAKNGQAVGIKDNMALVGILSTQLVIEQFVNNFGRLSGSAFD